MILDGACEDYFSSEEECEGIQIPFHDDLGWNCNRIRNFNE